MDNIQFIKRNKLKATLTKQDLARYACSGHLPMCIINRVKELHALSFKRLQGMKNGK
jgi:hypothetical protein